MSVSIAIVWLGLSLTALQPARAAKADGGYEGNRLPGDEGWLELGSSFLGDYVTVSDGIMTYDGKANPGSGFCGMQPAEFPLSGGSGTIEYRVRCRAIGGHAEDWHQFFLTTVLYNQGYAVSISLGRSRGTRDEDHKVLSGVFKPEFEAGVPPPTTTGTWEINEWVTVRFIFQDLGDGKYSAESWVRGPAGENKYIDFTGDYPNFGSEFSFRVGPATVHGAIFDLDYIRWSNRVVAWGTPLEPASTAPAVLSISPRAGTESGGKEATIKGGNFDAGTKVTFDAVPARNIQRVSSHLLTCVTPAHRGSGWVNVVVSNAEGSDTVREGFFYGVLPEAMSIRPARGTNLGGDKVTITGSGFQPGATVRLGEMDAGKVRVDNGGKITCRTPATVGRWSGITHVTVTNPNGGYATAKGLYTYERSSTVKPKVLGWMGQDDLNLPVAIQKLEQMPFHGVVLMPLQYRRVGAGTFTQKMADENTVTLKAVEFRRFKHNFLRVLLSGKRVEPWRAISFFEDWTEVLASYRRYARMAKEVGFEGIWLDVENYGGKDAPHVSYSDYRDKGKTFEEFERQVRLRGRQMMTAILSEFPDVKIITAHGLGVGTQGGYDLLHAFIDGLLEAVASDGAYARAQIIDGYEGGYYISTPRDYQRAYDRMRRPGGIAYHRTQQDEAWATFGRAAFGLTPSEKRLDFAKAQFISAMNRTDEYVWVWYHGSLFPANNIPTFAGFYAKNTDAYIQALVDFTGLARATPAGRYRTLCYWRMEEGKGHVTGDLSGLKFGGRLSNSGIWTEDTPRLPKAAKNNSALDFRANRHYLTADKFGHNGGSVGYRRSSHLGNLYFTDHTIEFSFWWDGKVSTEPQHLYGADGGKDKSGRADTFAYGGWIPAGSRKLVHWQRGSYGTEYGSMEIDLETAQSAGAYRFGQWANVAVKVKGIQSRDWQIFLNGQEVTNEPCTGVYRGHETVSGYKTPRDGKWRAHFFRLDLVLGARNADELGIIEHFNGMLDEFRITAGQVPAKELLCPVR